MAVRGWGSDYRLFALFICRYWVILVFTYLRNSGYGLSQFTDIAKSNLGIQFILGY